MRHVSVEMFEADVEAFVAAAEAGEVIIISRGGEPIVKLTPPEFAKDSDEMTSS